MVHEVARGSSVLGTELEAVLEGNARERALWVGRALSCALSEQEKVLYAWSVPEKVLLVGVEQKVPVTASAWAVRA